MTDAINNGAKRNLPVSETVRRQIKRLRLAGTIVCLSGLAGAGVILWHARRAADFSNNPKMTAFHRAEQRQMGLLFGKQGRLVQEMDEALAKPATQAALLAAATLMVSLGCYYLARIAEAEAKTGQ